MGVTIYFGGEALDNMTTLADAGIGAEVRVEARGAVRIFAAAADPSEGEVLSPTSRKPPKRKPRRGQRGGARRKNEPLDASPPQPAFVPPQEPSDKLWRLYESSDRKLYCGRCMIPFWRDKRKNVTFLAKCMTQRGKVPATPTCCPEAICPESGSPHYSGVSCSRTNCLTVQEFWNQGQPIVDIVHWLPCRHHRPDLLLHAKQVPVPPQQQPGFPVMPAICTVQRPTPTSGIGVDLAVQTVAGQPIGIATDVQRRGAGPVFEVEPSRQDIPPCLPFPGSSATADGYLLHGAPMYRSIPPPLMAPPPPRPAMWLPSWPLPRVGPQNVVLELNGTRQPHSELPPRTFSHNPDSGLLQLHPGGGQPVKHPGGDSVTEAAGITMPPGNTGEVMVPRRPAACGATSGMDSRVEAQTGVEHVLARPGRDQMLDIHKDPRRTHSAPPPLCSPPPSPGTITIASCEDLLVPILRPRRWRTPRTISAASSRRRGPMRLAQFEAACRADMGREEAAACVRIQCVADKEVRSPKLELGTVRHCYNEYSIYESVWLRQSFDDEVDLRRRWQVPYDVWQVVQCRPEGVQLEEALQQAMVLFAVEERRAALQLSYWDVLQSSAQVSTELDSCELPQKYCSPLQAMAVDHRLQTTLLAPWSGKYTVGQLRAAARTLRGKLERIDGLFQSLLRKGEADLDAPTQRASNEFLHLDAPAQCESKEFLHLLEQTEGWAALRQGWQSARQRRALPPRRPPPQPKAGSAARRGQGR
eukprot:TRINITY_DN9316_c0_g1_i9.p1 TRINITY_DN9316_c0_g1~~TRINITY_DN9316_c0_g1_i9.p1  ORF type:complete len:778 (+),score=99.75 TRINITY_DN9316_c0_g1_i9:72-2336(+)